jgi:dipeptidase
MGFIPQVPHTYAYLDGAYPIINEHQLAMGESTCDARFALAGKPVAFGGEALFDIVALGRVALERCRTARCAIDTMGSLAEKYGFYGGMDKDWDVPGGMTDVGEGGEALTLSDGKEAWVFEISPDDTGTSAIWAAQRVPEGHVTVVTNTFSIGVIDFQDSGDTFRYSKNLRDVAERNGLFDSKTEAATLDFTKTFRAPKGHADSSGHTMVDRRKWEVFRTVAPSMAFDPYLPEAQDDGDSYFPFSVQVEKKLTLHDIFAIHGSNYGNSPFDLSKARIGGPFGDPFRAAFDYKHTAPMNNTQEWMGSHERAISQLWTSYTTVSQSRAHLPDALGARTWYGAHAAATTVFLPIYPAAGTVPSSVYSGCLNKADRTSMYWAAVTVANYMARFYNIMLPLVTSAASKIENQILERASAMEEKYKGAEKDLLVSVVAEFHEKEGAGTLTAWWDFFLRLVQTNHDGMRWDEGQGIDLNPRSYRYPVWYMALMGPEGNHFSEWADAHVDPTFDTLHLAEQGKSTLIDPTIRFKSLYDSSPTLEAETQEELADSSTTSHPVNAALVACGIVVGVIAGVVGRNYFPRNNVEGYERISTRQSTYGSV